MDPFTMTDASGREREFVIAEDEFVGAVGTGQCPNGGVHVFETTGAMERDPQKVGYWNIDTVDRTDAVDGRCTAHVFDIHEKEGIMTIAFYNGGVRVVDISGLTGYSLGSTQPTGAGMKEIAFYKFGNADTWAAKTPHIQGNGDFYLYGNDIARGLDIYKFDAGNGKGAKPAKSRNQGTWMSASEAAVSLPRLDTAAGYKPFCLLPQ
jgi:hypothetical protein